MLRAGGLRLASIGPLHGGPSEFSAAVAKASADLEGTAELVIVYLPVLPPADLRAFLAGAARAARRAVVVGATTGGAAFTERGVTRTGVVGAVLGGGVSIRSADARNLRHNGCDAIHRALDSLEIGSARTSSVLALMDAYATDGETIVSALRRHTPVECRCFGAMAGDNWAFENTYVFHGGEVLSNAAVFVLIESPTKLAMDVIHGWSPVPDSRGMVITAAEGSVLRKLDDRPAAEVYVTELTRLGLLAPGEHLEQTHYTSELGVSTPFGEHLKVRAPLGVSRDGSIMLAGGLSAGDAVQIAGATPDRLVNAAEQLAARVRRQVGAPLRGALVFDCAARLRLLRDRFENETRAFTGDQRSPTLGLSSYGEIAKFGGSVEGFHNSTAVMVGW